MKSSICNCAEFHCLAMWVFICGAIVKEYELGGEMAKSGHGCSCYPLVQVRKRDINDHGEKDASH